MFIPIFGRNVSSAPVVSYAVSHPLCNYIAIIKKIQYQDLRPRQANQGREKRVRRPRGMGMGSEAAD